MEGFVVAVVLLVCLGVMEETVSVAETVIEARRFEAGTAEDFLPPPTRPLAINKEEEDEEDGEDKDLMVLRWLFMKGGEIC